jgi:uncharacterized protein (DUF427 family)
VVIAETSRAYRVLETSHPPVYYLPPEDVIPGALVATARSSYCEFKGAARYFTVTAGGKRAEDAAWAYPDPSPAFAVIRDHVAFYPGRMDACTVEREVVVPQPGGFYGGWITGDIVGPFKGGPDTVGW